MRTENHAAERGMGRPDGPAGDELLERYLDEREATCPACRVHVEGVRWPYLCPGCGHRLSLGLAGTRVVHAARPWMLGLFGLGVLGMGPLAVMVGVVVVSGNGQALLMRGGMGVVSVLWSMAAVVGALVSAYAFVRLLGRPSARALAGDLSEYRALAWTAVGCAATVGVGRLVVPVLGVVMP